MERLGAEKLFYHSDRLIQIRERGDSYPVHMVVGLTDYCNHHCIFCNSEFVTADNSRIDRIDSKVLLRFLGEAKEVGLKAVTICGSGEPLIYPDVEKVLYKIHDLGLDIGIFSNGAMMGENVRKAVIDTCTFIRFSVNASNTYEHEIVHRVNNQFDTVLDNVSKLVEMKKLSGKELPTIGTQYVFYEENYKSMVDAAKLWKNIGVDYFEIKPLIEGEGSAVYKSVFPAKDKEAVLRCMKEAQGYATEKYDVYAKYAQYENTMTTDDRPYKKCYGHALDPNLWSDGNLFLCSNQEHDGDIIGNIYESSFLEIWNGEKRKNRISSIDVNKCPRGCRCDNINRLIWDYLNPDELIHPNFI